jgi:hypothetical protein
MYRNERFISSSTTPDAPGVCMAFIATLVSNYRLVIERGTPLEMRNIPW